MPHVAALTHTPSCSGEQHMLFTLMPCYVDARHQCLSCTTGGIAVSMFFAKRFQQMSRKCCWSSTPSVRRWRWCKLCSPWHQALTACGLVVAALCGLHRVRTACWKCRWLTVVIFLSVGWWVYNYAGYPVWTTPTPIICRDIAGIIIHCGLFYPAKIIFTHNAGNPSKIKHLAPFAAIDLKSLTFEKHRLINSYPQLIHRYIP